MTDPQPQKILVAVAWPYANGPRHIGHVAGFGVPSDIFARYHRLRGNDVLMVSGTDEHGTPVMVAADEEGVSPRELADRYNEIIRNDLRRLGLSYDLFTRTTTENHHEVVRDVFRTLYEKGFIVEQTTVGAFSAATGRTLPDRYIEGTCPICGFPNARGDQCDNCGNQLDPADLIEPRSKIDGQPPVFKETSHLFLDLPAFKEQLAAWIGEQEHWRSNVRRFSLELVKNLKPRPVTRDLDWGVRVPVPGYEEREDKRIYVWIDAVTGYLSAAIEWARNRGTPDAWRDWWQNPDARHYYFMGKDNIVFHSVIWPAQLLGYGEGGEFGAGRGRLELPYDIVSSEFLTMEGRQFSTSRGVVIYVGDFLSRYDPDPLRYFLTAGGPETQDTDFTWAEFVRRNNDELVANWGNLVNRTLTSGYKNFGVVPEPGELTDGDAAVLAAVEAGFDAVGALIEQARFKAALAETMRLASLVNAYVSDEAPWATIKDDRERAGDRALRHSALHRQPEDAVHAVPPVHVAGAARAARLRRRDRGRARVPARSTRSRSRTRCSPATTRAGAARWEPSALEPGQALREPRPLFRKLDPDQVVADELRADGTRRRSVIDTHAHLDALDDPGAALVARARAAGVTRVVTIGTGIESCRAALALAERTTASTRRSASTRTRRRPTEAGRVDELRAPARAPEGGRGRRGGPRLPLRRATGEPSSAGSSRPSSSSPRSSGCRSSSTPARPTRTPPRSLRGVTTAPSSCTASPSPASSSRRSSAAGTSPSPATSPTRRRPSCARRPRAFPPTGSSPRRTAPYLAPQPRPRPAERARARPSTRVAALAAARGEDADELAARIDANATRRLRPRRDASRRRSGSASTSSPTRTSSA